MELDYGEEVRIPTVDGESLCFESYSNNTEGCSYIRFIDSDGHELAYWNCDEWAEDPQIVMGSIMGCIRSGATTKEEE